MNNSVSIGSNSSNIWPSSGAGSAINPSGINPSVSSGNNSVEIPSNATVSRSAESTQVNTVGELKQAAVRGERAIPGEEFVIRAIEKANKALEGRYTSFEFSVNNKTKQISIKVLDRDTGELIREIPPEKTLDMVARLWEMAGILVDEKR